MLSLRNQVYPAGMRSQTNRNIMDKGAIQSHEMNVAHHIFTLLKVTGIFRIWNFRVSTSVLDIWLLRYEVQSQSKLMEILSSLTPQLKQYNMNISQCYKNKTKIKRFLFVCRLVLCEWTTIS